MPLRIVNELPPSYNDCIQTLASRSQAMYDVIKFGKFEASKSTIEDDRLNNNVNDTALASTSDFNGNIVIPNDNALEMMNGKGVIKLDMSRIMDPTGLPTYEAALKLKSSSYI